MTDETAMRDLRKWLLIWQKSGRLKRKEALRYDKYKHIILYAADHVGKLQGVKFGDSKTLFSYVSYGKIK